MLEWLKRHTSNQDFALSIHRSVEEGGLRWTAHACDYTVLCDPLAITILQQLESDGFVTSDNEEFIASWDGVYSIINHPEYQQICSVIQIPSLIHLAPSLESVGTLSDAEFGISIVGWIDSEGVSVLAELVVGPILSMNGSIYLMPEASWRVVNRVISFWNRPLKERIDSVNRHTWGQIRQAAIAAGSRLSDFLYRSVVLTPEKLQIDLNRVDVNGMKVVEVIPSFAGCPSGWLEQLDRRSDVPDRFDIPTKDGIIQIIVTPAVKTVLNQIKQMPGRRVTGSRAEAFVVNPFATLGEDANLTIDTDQFERARIEADLVFERFTAYVDRDPMGNPISVGLHIEVARAQGSGPDSSILELFRSDDELEQFIVTTEERLKNGMQINSWRDYEFELLGDTPLELQTLREALQARRRGFVQISCEQVYDLSLYSSRVEDIGMQKPFYSPYIAKKDTGDGWFPENMIPIIVWTPDDGGEPVAVPLTPNLEKVIKQKLDKAVQAGAKQIEIPSFPRPIPVDEAQTLLKAFNAFRDIPPDEPPKMPGDKDQSISSLCVGKKPPTLVIKANIEGVDYEEARRVLLSTYSEIPIVPNALRENVTLKDHQRSGVAWLQHLFNHSPRDCRGVVLADDMGLGKTLQLLTLLAWAFERDPVLPPALIVAPVSLLENWQEEAKRFFHEGSLPFTMVYGAELQSLRLPRSAIDSQLVHEGLIKFLRPGWVGSARIVLTTYETLRDLEFSFAAEHWSVMICDEAQKIKNPNALVTRAVKKQNVRFKVACTGTPVENTLADLWCLFDFVQPGMLRALNEFGRHYRKPIEAKTEEEKARIDELRMKISAQFLRRTKKDVAKDLPNKIVDDACRSLPISPFQRSAYSQAVDLFRRRNEPGVRTPFKNHLGLLHYLRVVCTDPCSIGTATSTLDPLAAYRKRAPKLHWLLTQLNNIKERGEKVIVFCELRSVQRLLRHYIQETFGFAPDIINGDTEASESHQYSRQKRIRAFQEKVGFGVIILSPIAVGFGLNIQAVNHVIHYTRTWNPAKEDQATDRAYRIGQTKDVYVYYPVVTAEDFTTFDVKLDQLLQYKRDLAQDMLNGSGDVRPGDFEIDELIPGGATSGMDLPVTLNDVLTMEPRYFEGLAAALWQAKGYPIVYRTPDSGDDGVDVVAILNDQGVLIQCKSSMNSARQLSWDAIKDVVTGKASYRRRHPGVKFDLLCMTNQHFNTKAKEQALLNDVSLINQDEIAQLLLTHTVTFASIEKFLFSSWSDAAAEIHIS